MKLPSEFVAKMEKLLQDEASRFFSTYDEEKANGLRFNPLKIDRETFLALVPFALSPVPFCPTGFYYDADEQPGKHPYHAAGLYYIQEPSAMFVAEVLKPNPGETVLDLCAAPGGKTTQLAAMMKNQGLIVANEIHPKRARALSENIERFGITNALVTNETPEKLVKHFQGFFDKILVDAPCSGEGMFRKDKKAVRFWSQADVEQYADKQRYILDYAYDMLKEGGVLVYSTCTFSPEENEQTIEAFLQTHDDLELLSIEKIHGIQPGRREWTNTGLAEIERTARLWPHCLKGEGHFVAKIKKTGPAPSWKGSYAKPNVPKQILREYLQFEQDVLQIALEKTMYAFQHHLFALPDHCPSLDGLKIVRAGLHVGEAKKQRFVPNHALALSLKPQDVRYSLDLSSDSGECFKYLRGETLLTGEDRGWLLVTVDGYPLGWGKEVKGILKNFYPKGLRMYA